MPKGEDRAISGFIDVVEVRVALRLPVNRAADEMDDQESGPAYEPGFEDVFLGRRGLHG